MQTTGDPWADGASYEAYMGRWSRLAAGAFITWLDPAPGLRWLDVGCGTGALSAAVLQSARPQLVTGCDPSAGFIAHARTLNQNPRISFQVATLADLPQAPDGYGAVVAGLVLNFVPDALEALRAMRRRAAPGGLVAAYVWDYSGRMDFLQAFWEAAVALDPTTKTLDQSERFPLCRPERLESIFREAGLSQVSTGAIEIPTVFSSFADYWQPFLAGVGPAPKYVATLSDSRRDQLAEYLRQRLEPDGGGQIQMLARAWAVRGELLPDPLPPWGG